MPNISNNSRPQRRRLGYRHSPPPPEMSTNGEGAAQDKEKHVRRVLNMIDAGLSDIQVLLRSRHVLLLYKHAMSVI